MVMDFIQGVKLFAKRGWTADKLLKGAGAGSDPTEIDHGDFSSTSLIIETRTSDPITPPNGRIWLRTDL